MHFVPFPQISHHLTHTLARTAGVFRFRFVLNDVSFSLSFSLYYFIYFTHLSVFEESILTVDESIVCVCGFAFGFMFYRQSCGEIVVVA